MMKTTRLRNYSALRGLLLLALLNTALLNAQENVIMENRRVTDMGPYSSFTAKQRAEAGLVAAVDTGKLTTTQTWNYTAKEAGDYQLGTAWIEVVGPGKVTFSVKLNQPPGGHV